MTRLESAGLLLANELERYIALGSGANMNNLTLSLNEFRRAQIEADASLGTDLDGMFKQYEHSKIDDTNIISIAKKRIKVIK